MTIGIIGSGALGSNVARILAKNGIPAVISNSRGPASLASLVQELGPSIKAGTVEEAASADIVFAAIRWVDAEKVLAACQRGMGASLSTGQTRWSSSNPVPRMQKIRAIRSQLMG